MKRLIYPCLAMLSLLSLASCSKYYISSLSSKNMLKDEKTGEFKLENDSLRITYSFNGENAPVKINVFNKLKVPLYVDWSKSSLIFQEKATSYIPDKIAFSAVTSGSELNLRNVTFSDGTIDATIDKPKDISFIPPNASIETTTIFVKSDAFKKLDDSHYKTKEKLNSQKGPLAVKSASFNRDNSPVVFRSYLTLFTKENNQASAFAVDREFYVDKSIISYAMPNNLTDYKGNLANVFYNNPKTVYGKILFGAAVVGVVAGSTAITKAEQQNK